LSELLHDLGVPLGSHALGRVKTSVYCSELAIDSLESIRSSHFLSIHTRSNALLPRIEAAVNRFEAVGSKPFLSVQTDANALLQNIQPRSDLAQLRRNEVLHEFSGILDYATTPSIAKEYPNSDCAKLRILPEPPAYALLTFSLCTPPRKALP